VVHKADQPHHPALFLSIASTWLSLANQDDVTNGWRRVSRKTST
jgi:hypothetical protein